MGLLVNFTLVGDMHIMEYLLCVAVKKYVFNEFCFFSFFFLQMQCNNVIL